MAQTVGTGKQTIVVTTDAPGGVVCLWKGAEVYAVKEAGKDGKASFNVAPESAGTMTATVSGASLNSVTKNITVK